MNHILVGFLATLAAGLATVIGAIPVFLRLDGNYGQFPTTIPSKCRALAKVFFGN